MVWVLPVPGGPCTTTPSCVSSSWTILTCSSLKGLGKYKSFASAGTTTAGSWKIALTPRKAGSCTGWFSLAGSVTSAATASGNRSPSDPVPIACASFSRSWTSKFALLGRANSTQVLVILRRSGGWVKLRSPASMSWGSTSRQAFTFPSSGSYVLGSNGDNVVVALAKNSLAIRSAWITPGLSLAA